MLAPPPAADAWRLTHLGRLMGHALRTLEHDVAADRWRMVATDRADDSTRIITARLSGASALKVASLSGTLQATASDVRGFGWLRSDRPTESGSRERRSYRITAEGRKVLTLVQRQLGELRGEMNSKGNSK